MFSQRQLVWIARIAAFGTAMTFLIAMATLVLYYLMPAHFPVSILLLTIGYIAYGLLTAAIAWLVHQIAAARRETLTMRAILRHQTAYIEAVARQHQVFVPEEWGPSMIAKIPATIE